MFEERKAGKSGASKVNFEGKAGREHSASLTQP